MKRASFLNLGMTEVMNRTNDVLGNVSPLELGQPISNYGTETFLHRSINVNFDIGLDIDGQLLQFY